MASGGREKEGKMREKLKNVPPGSSAIMEWRNEASLARVSLLLCVPLLLYCHLSVTASSSRMCDQNVERESRSQHFICQLTLSLIEWLHILLHIKTPRTNCTKLKTIRKSILFVNSVLIFYITELAAALINGLYERTSLYKKILK